MQLKILARWYQMIKGVFGKFASFTHLTLPSEVSLAKGGEPIWLARAWKNLDSAGPETNGKRTKHCWPLRFFACLGKASCS